MAGEDVVIRVGVDYSAAIAQTRQFEQELRRILTSAAQVQIGAGSRSQAVGAGGPDLGRELKGINTSLQSLLAVTRQNSQSTPVLAELKGINTSLQSILSVSRQNARGMDASRELRGVTTALQTLVTQTRVSSRGTQSTTSGFDSSRELNRVGNTLQSILALSRQNQGTGNRDSGITELRSIDTSLRSILAISRQGQGNTTTSSGSSQELNQVNKTLQSLVVGSRPGVTVDNSSEFGKLNNSLQTLVAVTRQNTQANRTVVFVEREHRVPATAIAPSPPPTPSAPVEPVRVRVPEPINPLSSRGAFTESRASRELAATQNAYANALRNEIRRFSQPQIAPVSRELPRPAQPAPRPAQAPLGLPRPVQTPPSQMPLADFLAAQRVLTQPRSVVQAAELGTETGPVTRPVQRRYISPDLADFRQQYSLQERVQSLASRSREYRSALPKIDQTLAPQNFAGMERKYVEQIRLTMKRLFSWFPEVAKDLAFVGTPAGALDSPLPPRMRRGIAYSSGRKSATTAAINIAPEYGSKGGSIIFNPSEAGSFMDLAKTLPRAFMGGSFAGDLGVSSLAVHEFGHSLDRVRGGGGTLDALSKRNNAGNDRLLAQAASEISTYASTKVTELYAEAFSQALGGFPSQLGRQIYGEMAGPRAGDPGRRAAVLAAETNKFSHLTEIQAGRSEAIDLRIRAALGRILSPTAQAISSGNVQAMSLGRPILEPGLSDRVLYHGTTLSPFGEIPDVIRPSGGSLVHPGTTDPRYAYATPDPSSAMAYAEMAYQSRGQGFPAVLKVVPIGSIEEDPRVDANGMNRGNFKDDVRSLSGFRVVGKLPLDDEEEWLEPNEISAYHRKLEQYRELERATSTTPGGSALDTRNEIERYGQARRTRRAIEAEVQSVLPSSGQPIAAGKDLWSRLSDREAAALRFALDMKKPPTPGVSSGVFKPDEVIPPTVRGPEYGPHFSESRPVIETTGRVFDPLEAEFRRRDAARVQREQIQSQLRAQTEAQVKSIPASTTKTTTDIVAAQRDYIAGVRRATKAHEAEARSVLPSGDKPTALGSGRHPGDYSFQEWMKRPDVYSHATMVEGFDQGPLTHFGNVDQSLALTRGRFGKPSDVGLTRRELLSDGFGVTNPRLYSRRIARGNLFPGGISDQAANDAHLLFAADKGQLGEVRRSIRDSVSSVVDEIAGELDSWMDSAEEELLAYRQTNPAVDQAMSAFEGGQGVTYENIGEGYGNSIVVPRTAVGTSYFEDVLASPNRPQELKDAIRAALGGEVPYSPYSPIHNAPVRLGDPATDYSLLQNHQIREMLGLESKASTSLVLARNQYASEYRKAAAQLRAQAEMERRSVLPPSGQVLALGAGGAGIPPRPPRALPSGMDDWDDEFRRREIARQQREQMRRRLDAEAARTLRPVSETEMNAYKWRQGVIANTLPGAERTRRLLSGSPVGPDTPAPKALRYVSEEEMNAYKWRQKVIDTVPPGALRTKYLLGKNGQAQFEADQAAARWRQNIMDIIPPGSTRTKYLLGKDPFNLGSLDLTKNSGSETPAARARFAADVGNFRRGLDVDWPFLDTGEGITRSEYAKSLRGNAKKGRLGSLDKELETAELLIDPTSALASIAEVKIRLAELRAQVTRPERLNFLETASASAKADQQYMLEGLDAADARVNRIEARANRTISERALGAKSFEDLEDEDVYTPRKAAEDQVAAGRFHADTQKEIENDEELSASQMHSDVDAAEAKAHRQRLRDEEAIGRGRLDLVPLARRKQYAIGDEVTGALTDAESLKVAEARAKELSAAVRRSGLHDFRTPEGQTTLTGLLKEAEEARKFADSVAIPDGLSGERKLTAQRLIGEAAEELEFRKESPGPGSREDVAKAQKVRTTEEMGRRQDGVKALQDYHGVLKSEFSTLGMQTTELIRVGADTSGAKAKFRELLALLEKLEQEAATIDVKGLDSGSLKRLSQTREDIQKLRGGISPLGAQLFPQEPVTSPTYKDTRSGGRRFWDWMTTSDSRRGGGSGGSGGSGGGGGGGPIDPNDPFSFGSGEPPPKQLGRFSRVLARVRGAGGAASFFGTGALSTLRYGLPSMALYGAMGGISSGVREAQEFQFTMEKVKAQMEDTFGSGADPIFQSFKDNILDLSKTTGVQADVLASLGMQFQGAFSDQTIGNLSGQDLVKSQLDAAAKLSVATKIPAAELTDGLTAASFGFDKTNEEIGNIALRLESLSGVTAKETIGFIGDVAPVGKEAGFSAEEFAALAAVAQQKSGRSGTALAESFGRIIPAISQAKTQLLQLAAADDALRTPEFVKALSDGSTKDVLFAMLKNFKGLTKESQDFITNLLGGRREAQTLLSVVDSRGQIEEYTKGAKNSEGVLQARFESAQKTLTNQMARLRQEFNLLVASLLEGGLGEVFGGLISTVGLFVKALEGILKISGGINDFFGGLPGKILGVVAAVKLLSLASAFTGKHLAIAVGGNAATASGSSILPILAGKLAPTKLGGFMASRWAAGSAAAQGAGLGTFGRLFEGIRATRAAQATQAAQAAGMGSLGFLGQQAGAGTGAAAFGQQAAAGGAAAGARTLFAGGLTGLTAGAKGMATGVAGFLGISTAALGVGSVALAGLAVAYLAIRNGVNHQRKHAEEILKWASETDVSATELEALAKSRDSGPGNLARIGSFFTGERFLGDADIYRSVAFTKNISKDRLDAIGSLDSSAVNKALQDSLIEKPKFKKGTPEEAEASASARQDIREAQREALANLANGDFQKGEFGKGSLAAQIFGRGTGITAVRTQLKTFTGLFGGNQTGKAEDALKKRVAKMAGVDDIKDVTEEVSKAFGGKNPYGTLQEIATSYSTKYTEEDKRQALSVLEATERDPEVIKASQKARTQLEVARKSQTLETITKNRDTGVISFSQYEEAATRNLNNMREMLREQKDPSDQTLQMFFSGLAEFNKAVSQKAMAFAQMSLADAELSGFDTPLDAATAKLETYTRLLKSGKVTDPESRRQLVASAVQARKEAQIEMAKQADPDTARAILSQQIEIDPSLNVSNVIGTIGSVTGNWNRFSSQFNQATGSSAGAFIGGLVRGQQAGQLTPEQVVAQLEAKQKEIDAARKNLERRGKGDTKRAKSLEGASAGVQDIIDATEANGGQLPGYIGPAITEKERQRQINDANAQAMGNLAKAQAGDDSVAGAMVDLAVARQMQTNAEGSTFAEETQAKAQVLQAENALKKILREKSKATMAVVKAQALARKDSVAAALADVAQADIDYKAVIESGAGADSAEAKQAQANKITALAAARDAQIAKAVDLMQLKKLNSKGDSVQDAVINLDIARFKANNAIGDEKPQALLDLQAAEKAARDSLISRYKALRELEKAKQNDPVAGANTDLQTAQTLLSAAQNEDEKIDAQRQLIEAERALQQAMSDVRDSKYDLRAAELAAMGDDVGSAQVQAQKARAQLQEALGLAAQGKGGGEAELNRLRAAVVSADKSASDAAFNDKLDDYKFMYEMGTLTKMEYVNYLEGLKSTLIPGTKQFKDLELTIKQLKDDISGGLQMNLPTSLALPTLYEVRRLNQSVGADGQAAGYNDNRVVTITLNINNGADQAEMINVLNQALGTGTSGRDPRLY